MESCSKRISIAFAIVVLVPALWGAAPERGWLDREYPVAKLDGKRIFLSGLTRANTDVSGLKDKDGKSGLDSAAADSLLLRFNEGMAIYHGKLLEVFSGGKVDAGGHMEKMAHSLTDLLLRSDASLVKKYPKIELAPPAKAVVEKDETQEVLDTEEE